MSNKVLLRVLKLSFGLVHSFKGHGERYARERVKRILIINSTAIGDTLMCTPAIRALDEGFPNATLTALVSEDAYKVLKGSPRIDHFIPYPGRVNIPYLFKLKGVISRLRRGRFDLALVLFGNDPDAVLLAYLSGACFRMSMNVSQFKDLVTWYRPYAGKGHLIEEKLWALNELGLDSSDLQMEFFLSTEEEEEVAAFLKERGFTGPLVAIHPFGSKATRTWPIERVALLADRLYESLGLQPVILGGPRQAQDSQELASMMRTKPLLTAGEVSLRLSAGIIKRSKVMVSTDSGPMHISQAFNVPLVALLGSTLAGATGPLGGAFEVLEHIEACDVVRPCKDYKCTHISCMNAIEVDEVFDAIKRVCRI